MTYHRSGVFAVMLATFGLVLAMTRRSPQEKTIEQRMALIHIPRGKRPRGAESSQLFKATRTGPVWLAGRNPANVTNSHRRLRETDPPGE